MPVLKQTATCFTPPCMCRYSCIFSEFILREISNGLSFYVLERENRKAPNQHRLSSAFSGEPPNTAPPPFSLWRFYIHSKTACRGFKSFCPCHKPGGNTVFLPGFFLHVVHGNGVRFGSNSGFSHPVLPVLNRFHPLQHPKRTRFCPFWAFPGAFSRFPPFWTCKILGPAFVHSAS